MHHTSESIRVTFKLSHAAHGISATPLRSARCWGSACRDSPPPPSLLSLLSFLSLLSLSFPSRWSWASAGPARTGPRGPFSALAVRRRRRRCSRRGQGPLSRVSSRVSRPVPDQAARTRLKARAAPARCAETVTGWAAGGGNDAGHDAVGRRRVGHVPRPARDTLSRCPATRPPPPASQAP